ncbi:MAG TPA: glycosyltransferase family 39 protein [Bryobacteraceae bacterium]|nr:glycosyltransferase family 39 protein [Bryobacteraceae bacterium]
MRTTTTDRIGPRAIRAALAIYALWAGLLILENPGFQYDEGLLVLGSVHMRQGQGEITLPHDPDTWLCVKGHCLPLMTVRYVGAVKEYLCLPLFAIFGPSAEAVRLVSMLLGMLGIYGLSALIARQAGATVAGAAACVIAVNPAYVDLTVFDNGAVSVWMGALGLLCLTLSHYLDRNSARAAFWLGVAMGLGVWARANFVWQLASLAAAAVVMLGRRILRPASHWAAASMGGLAGGAPFLLYQAISQGGTWQAVGMFTTRESPAQLFTTRLVMFSETLLSDREHRAIWDGPPMPGWQRWLFPLIVLAACLICLRWGGLAGRLGTFVLLFLAAFLFLSRMPVAEHHLIVLVPLAAVTAVFAVSTLLARYRWGRTAAAGLALLYLGSALYWQVGAVRGVARTGGTGQWSDAVYPLADYLQETYPGREIKILDWGLQNNLYVLSDGAIRSREIYGGGESRQEPDPGWLDQIRQGGVFLLNGPSNRQFPAASNSFLAALAAARPPMRRFTVRQQSGQPYAEIVEITAAP